MSTDGLLQPYCVKWLVWNERPLQRALKVNSLLRDAFAKEASKPALAEHGHASPGDCRARVGQEGDGRNHG